MSNDLTKLISQISELLIKKNWKLVTAESCTGGGIFYYLTKKAGASLWLDRGFITYSNISKQQELNISEAIINKYGAVSKEVALAMAEGALENSSAEVSLAVTGIAGPDGGTKDKPVGTVWFGFANINKETQTILCNFSGSRDQIREQAIMEGLKKLLEFLTCSTQS